MCDFSTPVRCTSCGTWWRGQEHSCKPMTVQTAAQYQPKAKAYCKGDHMPGEDGICRWCGKNTRWQ